MYYSLHERSSSQVLLPTIKHFVYIQTLISTLQSLHTTNIICKIVPGCGRSQTTESETPGWKRKGSLFFWKKKGQLKAVSIFYGGTSSVRALKQTLKLRSDHLSCAEILWTPLAEYQKRINEFSWQLRWGAFTVF